MSLAIYAATRLLLLTFGWMIALALSLMANEMLAGARWPIFIGLGAWWTFSCVMFVRAEERRRTLPDDPLVASARAAKAALDSLP